MQDVFTHLNYTICTKEESTIELSLIVINNPDGTPRCITPTNAPKPYFLKFYNLNNFNACMQFLKQHYRCVLSIKC